MTELMFKCSDCDVKLHEKELNQGTGRCWECEYKWMVGRIRFLLRQTNRPSVVVRANDRD